MRRGELNIEAHQNRGFLIERETGLGGSECDCLFIDADELRWLCLSAGPALLVRHESASLRQSPRTKGMHDREEERKRKERKERKDADAPF